MGQFKRDKMTDDERAMAVFTGQPVDRVPVAAIGMGFNAVNVGYSIYDYYYDMEKAYDCWQKTTEQYDNLGLPVGGYPAIGPWELGGEIIWPVGEYHQCPSSEPVPWETEDDIWKLTVPEPEVLKTLGYMPRFLQFGRIAMSKGMPFALGMYGPWTTAGNIIGIDLLCKWAIKKPDLAHHVIRLATDFLVAVNKIFLDEFGPVGYIPTNSTASASNQLISPKQFQEFALPYIKEYHEKILAMGFPFIFIHICGEQNLNYPYYVDVPLGTPGAVSVSHEVDLETAIKYFPNSLIMGNIEPAVMQTGTAEEVYELARIALEKGMKAPGGFVLAPGCELPPYTPPYNVWMLRKAVDDFGWYQ